MRRGSVSCTAAASEATLSMASAMALRSETPVGSPSFLGAFSRLTTPALITWTTALHSLIFFWPQPSAGRARRARRRGVDLCMRSLGLGSDPPVALEGAADVVGG